MVDFLTTNNFNPCAELPHGVEVSHIRNSMNSFIEFLNFVNCQLSTKNMGGLETITMPANFSSIVGEYMCTTIPDHCGSVVKNNHHNGHPDIIPRGRFKNDSLQHGTEGIEIKASRYLKGWQGHNAEECFLMVFCYEAGRPSDQVKKVPKIPFKFLFVGAAKLEFADWSFSGRSGISRRTITASVRRSGYEKIMNNWIYKDDNEHG